MNFVSINGLVELIILLVVLDVSEGLTMNPQPVKWEKIKKNKKLRDFFKECADDGF